MSGDTDHIYSTDSDEEDYLDDDLDDGTTANKKFVKVVYNNDENRKINKHTKLRQSENIGFPKNILHTTVVPSKTFFNKHSKRKICLSDKTGGGKNDERTTDDEDSSQDDQDMNDDDKDGSDDDKDGSDDDKDGSDDDKDGSDDDKDGSDDDKDGSDDDKDGSDDDKDGSDDDEEMNEFNDINTSQKKMKSKQLLIGTMSVSQSILEEQEELEKEAEKQQMLLKKRDAHDAKKLEQMGQHGQNQITLWSKLLATRIHFQKILSASNQLPRGSFDTNTLVSSVDDSKNNMFHLLIKLRQLQSALIDQNPKIKECLLQEDSTDEEQHSSPIEDRINMSSDEQKPTTILGRKRQRDTLIKNDAAVAQEALIWDRIDSIPKRIKRWAFATADYWDSKTALKVKKQFKVLDQSPSSQVAKAMQIDFPRLLEKSISVSHPTPTSEIESYEDTDFYVSLLRDTITSGKNNMDVDIRLDAVAAGAFSKRLKKQDLEQKRLKFSQRTSKGRKIRYVPIPKLENFMFPEPLLFHEGDDIADASETAKDRFYDQLISSLFQNSSLSK